MNRYLRIAVIAAAFLSSTQIANAASAGCDFIAAPFAQTGSITNGGAGTVFGFPRQVRHSRQVTRLW